MIFFGYYETLDRIGPILTINTTEDIQKAIEKLEEGIQRTINRNTTTTSKTNTKTDLPADMINLIQERRARRLAQRTRAPEERAEDKRLKWMRNNVIYSIVKNQQDFLNTPCIYNYLRQNPFSNIFITQI